MKISNIKKSVFIYKNENVSYEDLLRRVSYLASAMDLKKGDKGAIFMENRPEWVYSLFSLWENHSPAVLMDVMSSADEIAYILKDCSPSVIFVSNSSIDTAKEAIGMAKSKTKLFNVDTMDFSNFGIEEVKELDYTKRNPEELAALMYTSGTTGDPKGVMLTFGNLNSNVRDVSTLGIITDSDTILALLYFHHSYPLMALILVPIYLGLTIVIAEQISSDEIIHLLNEHQVTVMVGVPRLYTLLNKGIMKQIESSSSAKKMFNLMKRVKFKSLRKLVFNKVHKKFGGKIKYFISGGARLEPEIAESMDVLGFTVLEGYGLTETSPIVAFNTENNRKIGSVGQPLPSVRVRIEKGEILVKGPNVMKGYYNRDKDTSEAIVNNWFYTGDLGEIDRDGFLSITGRKKEMIVLPNGKNLNPSSIEDKIIASIPFIKEIGVFENNGFLSAVVFPDFEALSEKKILNIGETIKWEIIDKYNTSVADYKKVMDYHIVNKELPKTRLGKLRRFMLPDLVKGDNSPKDDKSPSDKVYKVLSEYLKETSKKDVFFSSHLELDLGLDSIDKVDAQNFIERVFGVPLTGEKFSELMKLEDLYNYVNQNKTKIEEDALDIVTEIEDVDLGNTNEYLMSVIKSVANPSFKFYFNLEVEGLESIPKETNFILAPNHQSFLDAQVLGSIIPLEISKNTYSLAHYGSFESKPMKYLAKNINIITMNIDRNLKEVIAKLEGVLSKNKNLLIFPEGAVTRDGDVPPFKPLTAILSKKMSVPVIPVAIEGTKDALPLGSVIPKPRKVKVSFLDPLMPEEKETYEEFSERVRSKIVEKLDKNS